MSTDAIVLHPPAIPTEVCSPPLPVLVADLVAAIVVRVAGGIGRTFGQP